jgi:hypothetical protein
MGVTFLQHRTVTGVYSSTNSKCIVLGKRVNGKCSATVEWWSIAYVATFMIYVYEICLLLAGAIETACDIPTTGLHRSYEIGSHVDNDWNSLLNSAFLIILMMVYSRQKNQSPAWILKYIRPDLIFSKNRGCSRMQFLSNFLTVWTAVLNLVLIVICNTSILNPGPNTLNVMYQNVRGFVPFSHLGRSNMPLITGKLLELQTKVYQDKPDVIILTETWLSKEHLDNEIFPDNFYKVYRRDRSKRSHPPDPNNPSKFRTNGGGVLIAVRTGVEVENDKVDISSKAEMLSVSLKANNTSYLSG